MIVKETLKNGLTRTYSDKGFKIRKIGANEVYDEAVDVLNFEYEETNEKVEVIENE